MGTERISFGVGTDHTLDYPGATPNADELSSFSSNPNSLEASWNGSSYPYRSEPYHHNQHHPNLYYNHHKLPHRHVLTPPSPSRDHVPKRPRFAVNGLNVVESLIQNIFSSCGCVQSTAVASQQHPHQYQQQRTTCASNGFASKPLGLKNEHPQSFDRHYQNHEHPLEFDSNYSHAKNSHHRRNPSACALPDPPKVRRLTMQDASNDLDVTFMMH